MPSSIDIAAPPANNWFRPLARDRLQVCLRHRSGLRLRASGKAEEIWRMVELFEEITGQEVVGDWRRPPRTGSRPLEGQLAIQLESDGDDDE